MITRRACLVLVVAALAAPHAQAAGGAPAVPRLVVPAEPPSTPVGLDLDAIMDRGWIEFGVYDDFAPYSFMQDGKLAGVDIDLGELIAAELGVEARFRAVGAGESVDDDLRVNVWKGSPLGPGVVNVMLHTPWHAELALRNNLVVLTGQAFNEKIGIAWRKEAYPDGMPTTPVFRFDKIGVELHSLADFYLANFMGGAVTPNIVHYRDTVAAMAGMKEGETNAVMGPLAQLEYGAGGDAGLEIAAPPFQGLGAGEWTIGVAVNHIYRALGYSVDDAIRAAVEDGRLAAIFAKYGLSFRPPKW